MIRLYFYDKETKYYCGSQYGDYNDVLSDLGEGLDFTLTAPPNKKGVRFKWVDLGFWEVDDTPENTYTPSKKDRQKWIWQAIKDKRKQVIESGVYVESVGAIFQTDEASINQYNNIGNMIILDNYEPADWKVHDNSWVTLTVDLYKELQAAILAKTNRAFQAAEQHKAAMLQLENPEDYDYSENWI